MSQTTSAPGGDGALPKVPTPETKDRSKSEATPKRSERGVNAEKKHNRNPFTAIFRFIREIVAEMKKVHYPTKQELWSYFLVVIVFVIFMMVFTGLVDLGSGTLSTLIFG